MPLPFFYYTDKFIGGKPLVDYWRLKLTALNLRSWIVNLGVTLLLVGLLVVVFFLFEPNITNKTSTDISFMLLGLSIQLVGLACIIIGRK